MNLIKEASASCGAWPKDREQYRVDAPQDISQKALQTLLIWTMSFTLKKLTSRLLVSLSSVEMDACLATSMLKQQTRLREQSTENALCLTTLAGLFSRTSIVIGHHLQRLQLFESVRGLPGNSTSQTDTMTARPPQQLTVGCPTPSDILPLSAWSICPTCPNA